MATVKIEGKEVALPDEVVKAGKDAIRAVLVANGFPAADKADIQIEGGKDGAPVIVRAAPRSQGKGNFHPDLCAKLGVNPEDASPVQSRAIAPAMSSLNTARETVAVAKFLATESGIEFDRLDDENKLMLLGIACEVLKARSWHEEIEDFDAE